MELDRILSCAGFSERAGVELDEIWSYTGFSQGRCGVRRDFELDRFFKGQVWS